MRRLVSTTGTPAFREAMKRHGKTFEDRVYSGARDALFNDLRPTYEIKTARDAWWRTLQFAARVLGEP